jgi:glycosyltransferase involved in cell wall biosynthesis
VRVLIFHGYLLRGTGSNVYNASLARALARLGHDVHLLCQDREAPDLAAGTNGSVTIHTPDIGGLLPVFVQDTYPGFEVKTFAALTDDELERYIDMNVAAVRQIVESCGPFHAALANHLVMGPVILARAGLRYALKVHGSDLSYTVLPDLERFGPYAREAVASADGILVGSGHVAERLRLAVDDAETMAKVRLGPPGVDTELFAPVAVDDRPGRLRALAHRLRTADDRREASAERTVWDTDPETGATALDWYADAPGKRVIFVGKLIVSKGVDLLLASWPLVQRRHPGARLLLVGFGALEDALRAAVEGFARGDLGPIRELAANGRGLEGADAERLEMLSAFLEGAGAEYEDATRQVADTVAFAGRLEHSDVAVPVSCSDVLVFPSSFPEAFGMVAAEAAAAGAGTVSAHHSGAAEVSDALASDLAPNVAPLLAFELDDAAVRELADRIDGWLSLPAAERESAADSLRDGVVNRWSWEQVANGVLAAAVGDLEGLTSPDVV